MPHRNKIAVMAFAILISLAGWKGLNSVLGSTPVPKVARLLGENTMVNKIHKTDGEWKAVLTPEQYKVMRKHGTEPAFSGLYNNHYDPGIYVCAACDTPLFGAGAKYDHGTGWPSFTSPLEKNHLEFHHDRSFLMTRTEVRCAVCGSHLGHVFDDGPAPAFEHYCINSVALNFKAADKHKPQTAAERTPQAARENEASSDLEKAGPSDQALGLGEETAGSDGNIAEALAAEKITKEDKSEIAVFAAGCFWGVEYKLSKFKGVLSTEVGYAGGTTRNPTYGQVCSDRTGHAESVKVDFDPGLVSYEDLVRYFFAIHDPTQVNRQGPDHGTQYRSLIFYHDEKQKETARKVIDELNISGRFSKPIATGLVPVSEFYKAEEYHQKYYEKNKKGSCIL